MASVAATPLTAPSLVVEALSPCDQFDPMMRRINQFLSRGVQLVWLVDPEARTVTVCRSGEIPQVFEETETLSGFDLLPGFSCRVAEFFAIPGE
jgi:Uma2 family endonuclease